MRSLYKRIIYTVIALSWVLLFAYFIHNSIESWWTKCFPLPRRCELLHQTASPDGKRVAILQSEDSFLDTNIILYILDGSRCAYNQVAFDDKYWMSRDYLPPDDYPGQTAINWSADSTVVAVLLDDSYVFAYDFKNSRNYYDADLIQHLISSRADEVGK